ncbi:hypothetical protein SteCoe_4733 [Stentor coeruleus]|uniref:PPM-type phosphatase domain-containing protein n=1 Tax=Stentor coeruleus TaxID=5963 RepID=A0A1R2CU40_9CILI|nr:hypothetical protein SteCoe_4733 [Stentor coeruleus]
MKSGYESATNLSKSISKSTLKLPALSLSPKNSSGNFFSDSVTRKSPRVNSDGAKYHNPEIVNTAVSKKSCGYVLRFSANSHCGMVRSSNEDRLSIIINIPCPQGFSMQKWPRCSFFGIYDGHGGKMCANFLKEKLHKFIFENENFPYRPKEAIFRGFLKADEEFLKNAEIKRDRSGSCAVVVMVLGDKCYVANTGDSRAVVSSHNGAKIHRLTTDHKPSDSNEYNRIIMAGGSIKSQNYPITNSQMIRIEENCSRVEPGNLAVSRAFGDSNVKNTKIIIPDPEIRSFRLTEEFDFIVMASDGIFDKISDRDVVDVVWKSFKKQNSIEGKMTAAVEDIMRTAFFRQTQDNVSVILIAFKGIKARFMEDDVKKTGELD